MRDPVIAGTGMTRFARMSTPVRVLAEQAANDALADAGMSPDDVGIVFFANAVGGLISGQEMIRGQAALRSTGLLGVPLFNIENACASGASAFFLAVMAVRSGQVDVAMAVGAERMTSPNKTRTFNAIESAFDLEHPPSTVAGNDGAARSKFMDVYAGMAQGYMAETGATARDFAAVAEKNHRHAVHNPVAQFREGCSAQKVLNSRTIVEPLTLLMCSSISDGAAALVVCTESMALKHFGPGQGSAGALPRVRSSVVLSGRDRVLGDQTVVTHTSKLAYEHAGLGPEDVDVVELHDGAAPAELITLEELGLTARGCAPTLLADGETALGGRMPVNPSGGLLARGHPIGATGCAQLVELADQLRGRCGVRQVPDVRVALAENAGGYLRDESAVGAVTILSL